MNIPSLLAQVESLPPSQLIRDVGSFGWTLVLVVQWFMSKHMVTKEDLMAMKEEIHAWVETSFQSKEICEIHREGEKYPNHKTGR